MKLNITCQGSALISLTELKTFQPENLKKRGRKDELKLRASILKHGFCIPFVIWDNEGQKRLLDGHGRVKVLMLLKSEGYEIDKVPVVYVYAETEKEAKEILLQINSQYGDLNEDILKEWGEDLNFDDFELDITPRSKKNKVADDTIRRVKIDILNVPVTEIEYEALSVMLREYVDKNFLPNGFFASLLGIQNDVDKGLFFLNRDIREFKGAEYNPREIDEEAVERLKVSISEIGMCRPIIVNQRTKTIIAGHQRIRALIAMRIFFAPVFEVVKISDIQEARINNIHNGIEDIGTYDLTVAGSEAGGFKSVPVSIKVPSLFPAIHRYIEIIMKYGNIDSAICTYSGKVLKGNYYVMACSIMRIPARIFYIPDEKEARAKQLLYAKYGEFAYTEKHNQYSFIQRRAQPVRFAKEATKIMKYSILYLYMLDKRDVAFLRKKRMLDFGAGRCEMATRLKSSCGVDITPLEFFHEREGTREIDADFTQETIDYMLKDIKENGLYDIVICDSVINSVVSLQAESDVFNSLRLFCKDDGELFISGRCLDDFLHSAQKAKAATLYQTDVNGFTANMRDGEWFFQKGHSETEIKEKLERHNFEIIEYQYGTFKKWQACCKPVLSITSEERFTMLESVRREFDLKYNREDSYSRGAEMVALLKQIHKS
jgi:ParB family chromosome partitioning protein